MKIKQIKKFIRDIEKDGINFFSSLFNGDGTMHTKINFDNHATNEEIDCSKLISIPTMEEIKSTLDNMEDEKGVGPDCFTVEFVKKCWDMIHYDTIKTIHVFFEE
ncbi:uncharacterized protein LOC110038781 [Phalaenopsis equestris]|uniref:uncharacterized protein LOC110038781 n=1 Tax=Phalaenopsis equestris TaxID=78828 RepID=UPI0009E2CD17|nr:uncharacterized protein LOC110038781 [Phalaenopsis equestris]